MVRYLRRDDHLIRRVLEPLGLVLKAGDWYLVAQERRAGKARTYRVSRICRLELLEERFTRPADFELAQFWSRSAREFERSFHTFAVRLRVRPPGALALRQLLGECVVQALRNARRGSGGTRELVVAFESAQQARQYLLGVSDDVEVLEPPVVREALRSAAQQALELYSNSMRVNRGAP